MPTVITCNGRSEVVTTEAATGTETTFTFRAKVLVTGNGIRINCDLLTVVVLTTGDFAALPVRTQTYTSPVAAGPAGGGRLYDVVPGKPDESILVFRIESTDASLMMPPLGRSLVDEEGVALVRAWVTAMPGSCPCAGSPRSADDAPSDHRGVEEQTGGDRGQCVRRRPRWAGDGPVDDRV